MKPWTPTEAAQLMAALIEKTRNDATGARRMSLANSVALFAALKNPGVAQSHVFREVNRAGEVSDAALSRQLDVLEARNRDGSVQSSGCMVRRERGVYRTGNVLCVADKGEQFAREFADLLNRLVSRHEGR